MWQFPRLEPPLPKVSRPIQYIGGELNSSVKDWDEIEVRWALMYPDAYEVGQPDQGVQILYEVLNDQAAWEDGGRFGGRGHGPVSGP